MSRYEGRHAPRHVAPKRPASARVVTALRRPAVSGTLVLTIAGTGAAGIAVGDSTQTTTAAFAVSSQALAQANEQADVSIEDTARLVSDRNGVVAQASANTGQAQAIAAARAAKLAAERKAAALRAAREAAARKAIAEAKANPKAAAQALLADYGFGQDQWSCLEQLWHGESGWNYKAYNASSGATGIPQSLPGNKMASVGPDWRTNPVTQIKWGLGYIKAAYGSPCNAWGAWNSRYPHWY